MGKTGIVVETFLFHFLLFLLSTYSLFEFFSLENEEVEVSDPMVSKTLGEAECIEGGILSANYKFLIDRKTYWLG